MMLQTLWDITVPSLQTYNDATTSEELTENHRHTSKRNEVHISDHECISMKNVNHDHKLHLSGKISVFYRLPSARCLDVWCKYIKMVIRTSLVQVIVSWDFQIGRAGTLVQSALCQISLMTTSWPAVWLIVLMILPSFSYVFNRGKPFQSPKKAS